jgi:hypothetical protein
VDFTTATYAENTTIAHNNHTEASLFIKKSLLHPNMTKEIENQN